MKKKLPAIFALLLAVMLTAFAKNLNYTYIYQGPVSDLPNELLDPTNWIEDGTSPTFSCGDGADVTCSFSTAFNCSEPGQNHLNLDTDILLCSGTKIQFITLYFSPILFDNHLADIE